VFLKFPRVVIFLYSLMYKYIPNPMRLSNANAPANPQAFQLASSLIIQPHAPSGKLEAKAGHAALVFVDRGSAVLLRVLGIAEEHAFVSSRLLLIAYAAGLRSGSLTGGLEVCSEVCAGGGRQ